MIKRSFAIGLLLACFSSFLHAKGDRQNFKIYDFSKGVDTYHNPSTLPDGYVQNSLNVLFDDKAPVSKRLGFTKVVAVSLAPQQGIWSYTDSANNTWIISRIQANPAEINTYNPAIPGVIVSTVATANISGETNAFGNAYFTDQGQGVYFWDGSKTTYISGSPKGSIIATFHGRVWVAGAAAPNGNQLYGSKYFDGTTWTTGPLATDPVQFSVGLQDNFDSITGLYVYLDTLYIFKHSSIYALYGFDQTGFQVSQLTQECGCIDGNTIQNFNGGLKFVSLRGVEDFNGYTCKRISDPVKDKLDPAIQVGSFSEQSSIQSQLADWSAGTISLSNALTTTVASPALSVSTFSVIDLTGGNQTMTDNFSSMGNWSATPEGTSGVNWPSFTAGGNAANCSGTDCRMSSNQNVSADFIIQAKVTRQNSCGAACGSGIAAINSSNQGYFLQATDLSSGHIKLCRSDDFTAVSGPCSSTLCLAVDATAAPTLTLTRNSSTGLLTAYVDGISVCSITDTTYPSFSAVGIDQFFNDSENISAFASTPRMIMSQVYDTNTTGTFVRADGTWTSGTATPVLGVFTSNSSAGPFSRVLTSTGTDAQGNRYMYYSSTITPSGITLPLISQVTLLSVSSGSFRSQIHNVGAIGSWGSFNVDQSLNSGSIAYSICESTNSNMSPPTSCAVQAINSQINLTTGSYVQWYATFTVTATSQAPRLNSATVQWFTGATPAPMASTVWDNRYWLSLTTTTTDSVNDAVLVLNSRGAWTLFDIQAGGFVQSQGSLYHTESTGHTGNIYLDNQGYSDNGSPIRASVKTRDQSLGDVAADDYLYVLYPSASNTGSCAMTIQYDMDDSGNLMSLGSPLLNEFSSRKAVRLPFPIDSTHQDFGQSINFTVGTNDATCDWQFYGLEGLYKTRPIQ